MEEVDTIIIDSLRHLNCDIDEEITSLKSFKQDMMVAAISTCLEVINPEVKLPKKLPASMSSKMTFAANVARQIKELGFKGDMGYQTILYCNEVEVRKVLIFLIECLPKESSPVVTLEPTGYVPRMVKQLEDTLRYSLGKRWLPTEVMPYGCRKTEQGVIVNSFGNSCPIDGVNLVVPDKNSGSKEALYIPIITQQCSARQLIPSLLYHDLDFSSIQNWKQTISKGSVTKDISTVISRDILESISSSGTLDKTEGKHKDVISDSVASTVASKTENLREKRNALLELQEIVVSYQKKLEKVNSLKEQEQRLLTESVEKVKLKKKTLTVLGIEENKKKLINLIQKSENRLVELANQWKQVQMPLLEEHKTLQSSVSSESLKRQAEQNKLLELKKAYKEMEADFEEKNLLEQNLMKRCKELGNKNNRAAYTKRILEIVGNIQKQNKGIQKILSDTRQVQRDINNLTGQVDRSFTLSDELIFMDCKYDESARKAYKLLAALREECDGILQAVLDMGQAERELRNLEEQVETEKNKDMQYKLEQVQRDLTDIKKEIQILST